MSSLISPTKGGQAWIEPHSFKSSNQIGLNPAALQDMTVTSILNADPPTLEPKILETPRSVVRSPKVLKGGWLAEESL